MALGTKNRPDSDTSSNKSQGEYNDAFSDIIDKEFGGGSSENPYDYNPKSHSTAKGGKSTGEASPADSDDLNELESNSISDSVNSIANKIAPQGSLDAEKIKAAITKIGKSRSPLGVIFSLFGVTGVIFLFIFNPGSLLTSLSEMLMERNDSASTSMQRRILKVIDNAAKNQADHEVCTGSKMRCHMGKFSNSALRRLDRAGIKPLWDGAPRTLTRTGFPDKNPSSYEVTKIDGTKETVQAGRLAAYLQEKDNRIVARKVLGAGGAFSMRFRAFSSAHMKKNFYNKFRLGKTGGMADGTKTRKTMADMSKAIQSKIPGADAINQAGARVQQKVSKHLGKSRKGGAAYVIAVVGCVSLKAPKYIAAGVAAIQVAQLLVHVNDYVLSPGSKQKAHAFESDVTSEDVDSIGHVLNEKYPVTDDEGEEVVDAQGEVVKKSALESTYLMNALGVDDSGPAPSKKFTPALSILTSEFYRGVADAEEGTREACNHILSPAAMYTAMAVSAATTALASATIIGGVVKVAVEFAISAIVVELAKLVVGEAAKEVLKDLAENDRIEGAKGKDLGDILGIGAAAYFSGAGMARGLPVLTRGQAKAFNEIKQEEENFQREMDIAALSPLDTSSRHTFLGSMIYNTRFAMLKNRTYGRNIAGVLSAVAQLPSIALSPKAKADRMTDNYGKYAEYADMSANTGNTDDDPCMNFALTPCVGFTNKQAAITTDEAIKIAEDEEWFREDDDFDEDVDLFSLLETSNDEGKGSGSGYIKAETPLSDYMESCMDMSTGDYLLNTLGCMAEPEGAAGQANGDTGAVCIDEDGNDRCADIVEEGDATNTTSSDALIARAPLLVDFQILQSMNGFDDENRQLPSTGGEGGGNGAVPGNFPPASGNMVSPVPPEAKPNVTVSAPYGFYPSGGAHYGMDISGMGDGGWDFVSACDGVVEDVRVNAAYANRNARGVSGSSNYVWIKCDMGAYMGYAHFYQNRLHPYITPGYRITAGTPIAPQGNQGNSSGAHLHFQINPTSIGGNWYSSAATTDPRAFMANYGVQVP